MSQQEITALVEEETRLVEALKAVRRRLTVARDAEAAARTNGHAVHYNGAMDQYVCECKTRWDAHYGPRKCPSDPSSEVTALDQRGLCPQAVDVALDYKAWEGPHPKGTT